MKNRSNPKQGFTHPVSIFRKTSRFTFFWFMLAFFALMGVKGWGQATFTAKASANWNLATTWTLTSGADADGIPDTNDDVIIPTKFDVTLSQNESCASLALNGGGNPASLAISTYTLEVIGNITGNNTRAVLTITSGTLTIGGSLSGLTTFTAGTGTVNFNGSSAQTIPNNTYNFNNITVNNSSGATFGGNVTATNVAGTITVQNGLLKTNNVSVTRGASKNTIVNSGATFDAGTTSIASNTTPGSFTIDGTFVTANTTGFSGVTGSAISSTNSPTINLGINSIIEYNAAGSQTVTARADCANVTLTGGSKTIASGTLTLSKTLTINSGATYTGSTNNPVLNIGGDFLSSGTFTQGTGLVTFNGSAAQAIGGSASTAFNNVTISNTSNKITVNTDFSINASNSLTVNANAILTPAAAIVISGAGTLTGNGTVQVTRTSATADFSSQYTISNKTLTNLTVEYIGGIAQTVSALTYGGMKINNSNGVILAGNATVTGQLTFTIGKITTGSNSLIMGNSATVSGAGSGKYVYGNLQKGIAASTTSKDFEIGDASVYAPINLVFSGTSTNDVGNITAYTEGSEEPNIVSSTIDQSQDVNRYWSLVNGGVTFGTYSATFNFVAGDLDGGAPTGSFIVGKYSNGWTYPTVGTRTSTSTQATGLTLFSTFAAGVGGAAPPTMNTQPSNQSACVSTLAAFTTSANSVPPSTVVWEINTGSGWGTLTIASPYSVNTTSNSGITSSTLTIDPTAIGLNGYQYRAVFTNNKGNVASNGAILTVNATGTWIGGTSTAWNNDANWCGGKPTSSTNVVILSTALNMPHVTDTTAVCTDLTIKSGATLTIDAAGGLTVTGTLTNEAGTAASLIVKSTSESAAGTGSLKHNTTNVKGTIERYMSGITDSYRMWHLISSPIKDLKVSDFLSTNQNVYRYGTSPIGYPLAPYKQSTNTWSYYFSNTLGLSDSIFRSGQGMEVFIANPADYSSPNYSGILNFTGTLNNSDITIPVYKSPTGLKVGWNLVGNPYPSGLISDFFLDNYDVTDDINNGKFAYGYDAIYVGDVITRRYTGYNYASGYDVPPGQGFFIKAAATSSVKFTNGMRIHKMETFKSGRISWPKIELFAETENNAGSTRVFYIPKRTIGLDEGYDAASFYSGSSDLMVFTRLIQGNDLDFEIQSLPDDDYENLVVPIGLNAAQGMEIIFHANVTNMPNGINVYLEDKTAGTFTRLDETGSSYSVVLNQASQGTGRFYLHTKSSISGIKETLAEEFKVIPMSREQKIRIIGPIDLSTTATIFDIGGRMINSFRLNNPGENEITVDRLANGIYLLQIQTGKTRFNRKINWINQ